MALEIKVDLREGAEAVETVTVDRHLYLTEDGSHVVEEGDTSGRWLWATPGQDVPRAEAERLGAVKKSLKPPDKQARAPRNKGA